MAKSGGAIPQNAQQQQEKDSRKSEADDLARLSAARFFQKEARAGGMPHYEWVAYQDLAAYNKKKQDEAAGIATLSNAIPLHVLPKPGLYARMPVEKVRKRDKNRVIPGEESDPAGRANYINLEKLENGDWRATRTPPVKVLSNTLNPFWNTYKPWLQSKDDEFKFYKYQLGQSRVKLNMPKDVPPNPLNLKSINLLVKLAEKNGMGVVLDPALQKYMQANHPVALIKLQNTIDKMEANLLQQDILKNVSTSDETKAYKTSLNGKQTLDKQFTDATLGTPEDQFKASLKTPTGELDLDALDKALNDVHSSVDSQISASEHLQTKQNAFDKLLREQVKVKDANGLEKRDENGRFIYQSGGMRSPEDLAKAVSAPPRLRELRSFTKKVKDFITRRKEELGNPIKAMDEIEKHHQQAEGKIKELMDAKTKNLADLERRLNAMETELQAQKNVLQAEKANLARDKAALDAEKNRLDAIANPTPAEIADKDKNAKDLIDNSKKMEKSDADSKKIETSLAKVKEESARIAGDKKAQQVITDKNDPAKPDSIPKMIDLAKQSVASYVPKPQ